MTGNLDMNGKQIKNVKNATHNQDAITLKQVNDAIATTSTNSEKYTDQKIAESHISTHENRKNVLKYAMDDGEFTEDYGIQDVNLITFNDSPHKTNKKAFSLKVQKTSDGTNLFKGRFDFNLFKMIRDDFSDNYTVCVEVYFEKDGRHDTEFNRFNIQLERLNMNIDNYNTIRINSDYKDFRSILNLSPDGTSKQIQRRLYVTVQSTYDNLSPSLLPLYVLIYGIKGEAKNDLDFTIYDYEKAYEVADNKFQLHVPIDMNNQKITNLANASSDGDAVGRKYLADRILRSYVFFKTIHKPGQDWNLEDKYLYSNQNLQFSKIHIIKFSIEFHSVPTTVYQIAITAEGRIAYFDFNFTGLYMIVNINRTFTNVTKISIRIKNRSTFSTGPASFSGVIEYAPFEI